MVNMKIFRQTSNQFAKKRTSYLLEAIVAFSLTFYVGTILVAGKPAHANADQLYLESLTFGTQNPLNLTVQPKIAGVSGQLEDPPTVENVVAEIAKVFGPHGKAVVKQALDISMCESGWRADAYNFNTNKTGDYNIFQVNSLWEKVFGNLYMHNWVENVRVAHEIYLRSGNFNAWVCNGKI
jgi:hypothetical protein